MCKNLIIAAVLLFILGLVLPAGLRAQNIYPPSPRLAELRSHAAIALSDGARDSAPDEVWGEDTPTVRLGELYLTPSPIPSFSPEPTPESLPRPDITQKSPETLGPLEEILQRQKLGAVWPANPIKYAIRGAVKAGVPTNTLVLLLLLPLVALVIAVARNIIGIRGFGIFLPASLSVVFVAIGPVVGIGLFLVIVLVSTSVRIIFRKLKIKLQYLPRMALILWAVVFAVLGVLFSAPYVKFSQLTNVSIFAVLILVLLAEDFIRVQLGKSAKTAIGITSETLVLSLFSYLFLTLKPLQSYVLLNPEITLLVVGFADFMLARYSGLRLRELWRFRKLISS